MALTDDAIARIREMIIGGDIHPGDRLPPEADLAAQLGLSRNSLREAVRALSVMGVLDVRQGDGTYVTSLEPSLLLGPLSLFADLQGSSRSVTHFFEVRRILEPAAAEVAAVQMGQAQADALVGLVDDLGPTPSLDDLIASDRTFHRAVAEGTDNPILCSLIDALYAPTVRTRVWRGLEDEGAVGRTLAEHRAIARAISERRPDVARAWATAHVAGVEQWVAAREAGNDGLGG